MKLLNRNLIFLLILLNCIFEAPGNPRDNHTAASPSYADVSGAISAAHSGDTVTIPRGRATWDHNLVITKSIQLIGAGIGQTIIKSNYADPDRGSNNPTSALFAFWPSTPSANPPFKLSGMTIDCNLLCAAIFLYNATSKYPCDKIRLDHLNIINCRDSNGFQRYALARYGTVYGVMDNCTFGGMISNQSIGSLWTDTAYNFGDDQNFYIEDCVWDGAGLTDFGIDGNNSTRYCLRHNTIDITGISRDGNYPLCDMHGAQPSSQYCSSQGVEIYENDIILGTKVIVILDQRGGKALVYNNRTTASSSGQTFTKVRQEWLDSFLRCAPPNNLVSGQPQHISDSYYFGNRENETRIVVPYVQDTLDFSHSQQYIYNGTVIETAPACLPFRIVPQKNMDFWVEKASFDGSSGIGVGPLADRPITCTIGVAYWATDTKILYKCKSINVWTEYYKPYPYPHPLRTS